jgi:hypothetical protein
VDWEHMARKSDPIFDEVINNCERQRVKTLMGFRQDWNKEIIAQFYATVHFGYIETERAMTWMTNGQKYSITFHRFLRCFGIMAGDKDLRKLHDEGELDKDTLHLMYPRGEHVNYGKVKNLYVDGSNSYPPTIRKRTDLHLFHHGIPKVLVNPRSKGITSA